MKERARDLSRVICVLTGIGLLALAFCAFFLARSLSALDKRVRTLEAIVGGDARGRELYEQWKRVHGSEEEYPEGRK